MPRRIVDTGRVEVKGAVVRFKQKGTLEASDRNLAELERVLVRATPSPELRTFADLVFPHEVFRVWQDSTLVNYKDFLDKVELAGIGNFRSMLAHLTRAAPETALDATSRAFVDSAGPPERFVNKDELADYDRAVGRGGEAPARGARTAATRSEAQPGTAERRAAAEAAWEELAPSLAESETTRTASLAPIAGGAFLALALITAVLSVRLLMAVQRMERIPAPFAGAIAGSAAIALLFFIGGVIYLRRGRRS